MRCREFRSQHAAYVDDVLSAHDMDRMHAHLDLCAGCARHDTAVRRGLLVFRNMPGIAPSADFGARLEARLRDIRGDRYRSGRTEEGDPRESWLGARGSRRFSADRIGWPARPAWLDAGQGRSGARALVAAAAIAAVAAITVFERRADEGTPLRHAPVVVASLPEPEPVLATQSVAESLPMYVTPVPMGMGIVPAVLTAGQATVHFASLEYGR